MKKQNIVINIVVVLVLVAGAFYGGMQYAANKASSAQLTQGGRNGGGFGAGAGGGQRGMAGGQGGGQRQGGMANGGAGDFSGGQITAKDNNSVTLKTRNGSSQIVFFSSSTSIDKSVAGSTSDLSVGQQITASGKSNPDGSLAAQSIQIRPTQPAGAAQ
ncbi:MAG: DUF5666 domain-containing protein [Candidatus Moranbacteria bacterium]|nr:DUF5666 domain-containing protein [Candidatus Moranbacteria bacterium]